jgi:transcription initiation factor IIE alpha subunit
MKDYIQFCLVVVRQRFGPLGHDVAHALAQRNGQTIPDLAKRTGIDLEAVAQVLAAMLQHDVVRVTAPMPLVKPDKSVLAKERRSRARRRPRRRHDDSDEELEEDDFDDGPDSGVLGDASNAALFGDIGSGGPLASVYRPRRIHIAHPCVVIPRDADGVIVPNAGSGPKAGSIKKFVYHIDLDMLRGMSRFSEYLALAERCWGKEGAAIIEEFCVAGKRTVKQVISAVVEKLEKASEAEEKIKLEAEADADADANADANTDAGADVSAGAGAGAAAKQQMDVTKMSLEELTSMPQGKLNIIMSAGTLDEATMVRLAQAGDSHAETLAHKVQSTFHLLHDQKFIIPSNGFFDDAALVVNARRNRKRKLENPGASSSSEFRLEEAGASFGGGSGVSFSGGDDQNSFKNTVLIINHDRFLHLILSDMAYAYVANRYGPIAGRIVVALLRAQVAQNKVVAGKVAIHTMVHDLAASDLPDDAAEVKNVQQEDVDAACNLLSHISVDILGPSRTHPDEFYLLSERLLQHLRLDAALALVRERCGPHAGRIFNLLASKARLEEKQVSDFALLPKKEAKEVLYLMLQAHFVELQEVPRTTERQPSKAFFLWSLPYPTLSGTLLSVVLQAWNNLQTRLLHETAAVQTLLDKGNAQIAYNDAEHGKVNAWAFKFAKCEVVSRGLLQLVVLLKDLTP